jgi:hypothetical protein
MSLIATRRWSVRSTARSQSPPAWQMSADVTPPSADVTSPFDPLGALVAGREVGAPECRPSDARGGHLAPPARKAGRHCPRCRRRHLARCGGRQRVPGFRPPRQATKPWPTRTTRRWTSSRTTSCPPRPSPTWPPGCCSCWPPHGACFAIGGSSFATRARRGHHARGHGDYRQRHPGDHRRTGRGQLHRLQRRAAPRDCGHALPAPQRGYHRHHEALGPHAPGPPHPRPAKCTGRSDGAG